MTTEFYDAVYLKNELLSIYLPIERRKRDGPHQLHKTWMGNERNAAAVGVARNFF